MDNDDDVAVRALRAVMANENLWQEYTAAIKTAKDLDLDFPEEDYGGPVGRAHILTAMLRTAGIEAEPALLEDFARQQQFLAAAFEVASGKNTRN